MNSKKATFAHLHLHSEHSPLDGACRMDRLMERVKTLGMEHVGLTDHGTMSGLLKFQNAANKAGVKPILGMEAYFTEDRFVKDPKNRYYHLTLLAETTEGYQNLCKLSALSNKPDAFYHKPRCDYSSLKEYGKGIIVLTGCMAGRTMQRILDKDYIGAHEEVVNMMECVGEENVYVEVQDVGVKVNGETQRDWNRHLSKIAKDLNRPLIGTGDVHYLEKSDAHPHDAMLCVQMKTTLDNPTRMSLLPNKYYLRSPQEMMNSLSDFPESIQNTLEVAERCNAQIETGREFDLLPKFPLPVEFNSKKPEKREKPTIREVDDERWERELKSHEYLQILVNQGIKERYGNTPSKEVLDRVKFEMDTIISMGFPDYFLIIWDKFREANERGIPMGPGRGCLTAENRIWTADGFKPINNIEIGDTIITHNGELSKVKKTFEYNVDEIMITIRSYYDANGVKMTKDHKVLIEKGIKDKKYNPNFKLKKWVEPTGNLQWVKAQEVQEGDLVVVPKPNFLEQSLPEWDLKDFIIDNDSTKYEITDTEIIEKRVTNQSFIGSMNSINKKHNIQKSSIKKYLEGNGSIKTNTLIEIALKQEGIDPDYWKSSYYEQSTITQVIPRYIKADDNFCILLGLMAADGWVRTNRISYGLCENSQEPHINPSIHEIWQNVWGSNTGLKKYYSKTRNLIQYEGSSRIICNFYRTIFNEYEGNAQTKHLPEWVFSLPKNQKHSLLKGLWAGDGSHKGKSSYSTTSEKLMFQVRTLLWSLNIVNGCKCEKRTDSREGFPSISQSYKIVTSKNFNEPKSQFGSIIGDKILMRVNHISESLEKTKVYDFSVENKDSSYLTENYIVHNSGAGSIVLYALNATQLDPLEHGLLFERFLNPSRINLPDVDSDISPVRRKELMDYMREKYGEDYVSQIITFGRIGSKAGIRRGAQAMGKEYLSLADKISKSIPTKGTAADPLDKAYEESSEFRTLVNSSPDAKKIFEYAQWMEGMIQNEGVHAAALIVSPDPIDTIVPIQKAKDGNMVTAFDMKDAENVGLLKLDFLGLRNLDVIAECERLIKKHRDIELDAWKVPTDDPKTFEMLSSGNSIGVFQFECLAGDTVINGEHRTTIQDLYNNPPQKLLSIDLGEGKRKQNKVLKVVESGKKQLYQLATYSGYTLRASADHMLMTDKGWKKLIELKTDDLIVVNRKDSSRIGVCTSCFKQTKSRTKCTSCRNIERNSGVIMSQNRDSQSWLKATLEASAKRPWWNRKTGPANLKISNLPHKVRSHWEADMCLALKALDIKYEYEKHRFPLKNGGVYTPDLYLPEWDLYLELKGKGGLSGRSREKVFMFKEEYPDLNIEVISSHQIAEFEIENPSLAEWNCPNLPEGYDFEPVLQISKDKIEMTYDIMMKSPLNNFIANGIMVHNSGGMSDALKSVGADTFADLVAIVALYRPGPMAYIPVYARRKKGVEEVVYGDERLTDILGQTYGLIVYQEQSMLVSRELAGFSPGEADTLRKAIGKKNHALMAELKPKFMEGCKKNGVKKEVADELWASNEASAEYSFNKSHAAAYALISYVTAFLKANYPEEYMAALLSSVMSTKDKVPFYLYETKKMGLIVLPPDINESFSYFEPAGENTIRFGLTALKGVGELIVNDIANEREENGRFKSMWDFVKRVPSVNKREMEAMILTGAFDSTGETRAGLMEVLEQSLKQAKSINAKSERGQGSLFDMTSAEDAFGAMQDMEAPVVPDIVWDEEKKFEEERKVAGIYVSGHPLDQYREAWERVRQYGMSQLGADHIDMGVTVAGLVTEKRIIFTKRDHKKMLVVTLEDFTGSKEIVVFHKTLEQNDIEHLLEPGKMAVIRVSVKEDDRSFYSGDGEDDEGKAVKLSAITVFPFNPETIEVSKEFTVNIHVNQANKLPAVKNILLNHPGNKPVKIVIVNDKNQIVKEGVMKGVQVESSEKLVENIRKTLGG